MGEREGAREEISVWDEPAVQALYDRGLYLQALRAGEAALPLRAWPGTRGKILAGRLAHRLGARWLGERLHQEAWRADPRDAFALYYRAAGLLGWRGPLAAWEFLARHAPAADAPAVARADLLALRARVLAGFRDFARAEAALAEAEALTPGRAWLGVEHAGVLEAEDRYAEGLERLERVLAQRPWYAPAVVSRGHLLLLVDRDEEAAEFLRQSLLHTENAGAAGVWVRILHELGRHEEAWSALERMEALLPLAERRFRQAIAAQRSELAYLRGDAETSIAQARLAETEFHRRVVQSLERSPTVTRKVLPVAFVRQHHMTCGPASLTALGRYFEQPTEHLEVAEKICYGGTTNHSERRWAELNGFVAREFTVTHAGLRALIDRGLPFAVSTVEATSGHMQVIVGYDENRDSFLVRDPYQPMRSEWLAQEFLERYRASGPRGLVLVPTARAGELEGLALADSELYDLHHRLQSALEVHDWAAAEAAQRELEARAPEHRLVHQGRLALSSYAQDMQGIRSALEGWLALHPRDPRLLHMQVRALEEQGRREERLRRLEAIVDQPGADPIFRFELARLLAEDARQRDEAERQLRLALRRAPQSAANLWLLSRLVFETGERERALELLRFAVCLEETNEGLAETYFGVSHTLGRPEQALALLRERFERFARRSSLPARSLFRALDGLRRTDEAFVVLERALEARPEDGSLFLFAAASFGGHGRTERARELLARAGSSVHAAELRRTRADLAIYEGDLASALAGWREVAEHEPLAVDARQRIFALVKALEGEERALREVRDVAARFPFHAGLQRLCIGLLGGHPAEAEGLLLALLERQPTDGWALRELALRRLDQNRPAEALEALREARAIDPREASTHGIEALAHQLAGRTAEALAAARAGVTCSVDHVPVLDHYLRLAWQEGQGPQALAHALECLRTQHTDGDGLLGWWNVARSRPEGTDVLAALEGLRAERPELWQAHVALVRQRLALQQEDEALEAARAACERLPLHQEVWLVLALVYQARGEHEEERRALESALALDPRSDEALRQLALLHERRGEHEPSRQLLERAIALSPLDVKNHCWLADTLLLLGRPEEAVARVEHALRLAPRDSGVWQLHARCARAAGRAERTLELLREGTRARPEDTAAWRLLADALREPEPFEERLAAARHAHEVDAQDPESLDLLARVLGDEGRITEALEILARAAAVVERSIPLRGRRAWLLGRAGRREEAVELFRELLRLDPDYGWGWRQLAGLLDDLGRHAEYRDAAAVLVRQAPADPMVHTLLGDAREKCGDRRGAMAAYRQALALNPAVAFAAEHLLELQLEDGDPSGARETLARSQDHLPLSIRAVQGLRIACAEGAIAEVERDFAAILRERALEPWALRFAAKTLKSHGYAVQLASAVQSAMADGRVEVGELWLDLELARGEGWGRLSEKVLALPPEAETTRGAIGAFLDEAADQKQLRIGKKFLGQCQERLAGDARTWGAVGRFWLVVGEARTCERWLADWQRPDAAPWMLLNLGLAQRSMGQRSAAHAVSERALALEPDHTTHLHHAMLAADGFLAGDLAAARRHLGIALTSERGPYFEFLARVVGETLKLQASQDPRADFPAARRAISEACAAFPGFRGDAFLRELQLACVRASARARGGLLAWLWWARQRL